MPLQVLELVIFAALAAVVLFQLYAVLGRRVGRQPEDAAEAERVRPTGELEARRPDDAPETGRVSGGSSGRRASTSPAGRARSASAASSGWRPTRRPSTA